MTNDYYYYSDEAAPPQASRLEKVLKRIMIAAAAALGVELIWLLGITPFMPLSRIEISGDAGLSREMILSQAGIGRQTSYAALDAAAAEEALEELCLVGKAQVFKYYPDRVMINLEGRKALAVSLSGGEDRMLPVIFDREGVVLSVGEEPPPEILGPGGVAALPVISGLVFENPYPGMRIPPLFHHFLAELDAIREGRPELLSGLSELRIVRKSFDGFEIILYPVKSRVKVRLGPELNEDLLRYTLLMVDVADAGEGIDTLDFRTGMASYTLKEVSSD